MLLQYMSTPLSSTMLMSLDFWKAARTTAHLTVDDELALTSDPVNAGRLSAEHGQANCLAAPTYLCTCRPGFEVKGLKC